MKLIIYSNKNNHVNENDQEYEGWFLHCFGEVEAKENDTQSEENSSPDGSKGSYDADLADK